MKTSPSISMGNGLAATGRLQFELERLLVQPLDHREQLVFQIGKGGSALPVVVAGLQQLFYGPQWRVGFVGERRLAGWFDRCSTALLVPSGSASISRSISEMLNEEPYRFHCW